MVLLFPPTELPLTSHSQAGCPLGTILPLATQHRRERLPKALPANTTAPGGTARERSTVRYLLSHQQPRHPLEPLISVSIRQARAEAPLPLTRTPLPLAENDELTFSRAPSSPGGSADPTAGALCTALPGRAAGQGAGCELRQQRQENGFVLCLGNSPAGNSAGCALFRKIPKATRWRGSSLQSKCRVLVPPLGRDVRVGVRAQHPPWHH